MKSLHLFLLASLLLVSCKSSDKKPIPDSSDTGTQSPSRTVSDRKIFKAPRIIIETSMGTIKAKLFQESAPITVDNFLSYVDDKHFDNTIFHRVIPGFMIQGGGFEIKDEVATQKKTKDPIQNESAQTKKNLIGTLAMARTNDPHSATCQFFINVADNASLDHPNNGGGYAVFGEVTEGMDIVNQIKDVPTNSSYLNSLQPDGRVTTNQSQNVPVTPVTILSIRRDQ